MTQSAEFTIPPLRSGGVMLSYRCPNECRHCLYRCSPTKPNNWMAPETAELTFSALAAEPQLHGVHIGGGEPFLNLPLLEHIVRLAAGKRVRIDYVETNAFWAKDTAHARAVFERLREAGLHAVLVSVSMFHNEFVPFDRTRNAVEAAADIFEPENVIVYLPQIYEILAHLPDPGTHTLEEFCRLVGLEPGSRRIRDLFSLIPGGRVPEKLREYYDPAPADRFRGQCCRPELLSVTHFHVDPYGNLFTGCCGGIASATAANLHPQITPETHPVFCRLCDDGPFGLMEFAVKDSGYAPREAGYISKCDLCIDVRQHLLPTGRFPDLRPADFYS